MKKKDLLSFFQSEKPKPANRPENEGCSAKPDEAASQNIYTPNTYTTRPSDFLVFRNKLQTAKVVFITHTEEISFEDFVKFRPDKQQHHHLDERLSGPLANKVHNLGGPRGSPYN